MPGSSPVGKRFIAGWFGSTKGINRIIDFGAGQATYPSLLTGTSYHWIAVEVFAPYVDMFNLRGIYDEVIVGDLREIPWPKADCLIFGDVLEHLSREDVEKVIERSKDYPHVVISLPLGVYEQGAINGNEAERHVSTWEMEECVHLFKPQACYCVGGIGVFIR